jgi:hypothetical protein
LLAGEVWDTEGSHHCCFLPHHTREHRARNVLTTYMKSLLAALQTFLLSSPRITSGSINTSLPVPN